MPDQIYVPDPADSEKPVDYVANPLRVELPGRLASGRKYTRLDLVALANSIIARETECRDLRETVARQEAQMRNMELRLRQVENGPASGKLARMLTAIAQIEDEYATGDDD